MSKLIIGVWAEPSCNHLAEMLEQAEFSVVRIPAAKMRDAVISETVQVGLVPTLSVLREPDLFSVVPQIGFSSEGFPEAEIALKYGLEGLGKIKRIAFDPQYAQEIVLARIVLREHYQLQPKFYPVENLTTENMFTQAEAALVMYQNAEKHAFTLDLGLEWLELVLYPMMWGLFVSPRERMSAEQAQKCRDDFATFGYVMDDVEIVGLNTMIEALFFHGVLDEMPELAFYEMPDDEEE